MLTHTKSDTEELKRTRAYMRNNSTATEALAWKIVGNRNVDGLKFRRQHSVGRYILDLFCPEVRLCIEVDGCIHKTKEALAYDCKRTRFLNDGGIAVMRFDNIEVFSTPHFVVDCISKYKKIFYESGGKAYRPAPRRCLEICDVLTNHPCPSFGKGGESGTFTLT